MTKTTSLIAFLSVISISAAAQKKAKPSPEFPKEMAASVQAGYLELWEKGKVLYEINCAKCHNTVVKNRFVIPDFTAEQIKGYEIRVMNPQHEATMPDERVTAEELVLISTFLQYKKKNK